MDGRSKKFRNIFRALVIGLSAPGGAATWLACSTPPSDDDILPDATADATTMDAAKEMGTSFPDGTAVDSYVGWWGCEAGKPVVLGGDGCYTYLYLGCGIPPWLYVIDDAGTINRCDQICYGYNAHDCEIMQETLVDELLEAGAFDGAVPDAGVDVDADPDADVDAGPIYVICGCYNGGRRPVGLRRASTTRAHTPLAKYFAQMAHLEAASVPAFMRMRDELHALGAPRDLLRAVDRAIRDEERHARVIGRIARHFGAAPERARVRRFRARGVEAMARENAIEGCVRETYGALVATWQASHASDPAIRKVMTAIARDETRHAELSWEVDRFLASRLDARAVERLRAARTRAIAQLAEEILAEAPHADLIAAAGLPSRAIAERLVEGMQRVWA